MRNGDFASGLQHWRVAGAIADGWNPLAAGDGTLSLTPPDRHQGMTTFPYFGKVVFQTLNVVDIAGRTATLTYDIQRSGDADGGTTVQPTLYWLDTNGIEHRQSLAAMADADIAAAPAGPTAAAGSFTFPADASRLIRFAFHRNHTGRLAVDNVSLDIPGVTPAPIPTISSLAPATPLAYGDTLTISGSDFGPGGATSRVLVDGRDAGLTVTSWSDSSIEVTLAAPLTSGRLRVEVDGVQSNGRDLTVTSPCFEVDGFILRNKLVPGEPVRVILGVRPVNGYTFPAGGISLALVDPSGAPLPAHSFAPATLHRAGGSILTMDTFGKPTGRYEYEIHASDGTLPAKVIGGTIRIVDVASATFVDLGQAPPAPIANWTATRQGQITDVGLQATDDQGNPILGDVTVNLASSDPAVLLVHRGRFGPEVWARANGDAQITATYPDGTPVTLPVTVAFPAGADDPVVNVTLDPAVVTNAHAGAISFQATANQPITNFGHTSNTPITNDTRALAGDRLSVNGTFELDRTTPPQTESDLFYATASDGAGNEARDVVPLVITEDPSYARISGWVTALDPNLPSYLLEAFALEFYDADSGALAFSRDYFGFHGNGSYGLGGLAPGRYTVRCVIGKGSVHEQAQWYPNSADPATATALDFLAGNNTANINFFFATRYGAISGVVAGPGGVQAGAPVYPGVTVRLFDLAGNQVGETVTGADGSYRFDHVAEGAYTLGFTAPAGTTGLHFSPARPNIELGANDVVQNIQVLTSTSTLFFASRTANGHLLVTVQMRRQTADGGDDTYTLPRIMDLTVQYDGALLAFQNAAAGQALTDAGKGLSAFGPTPSAVAQGWQEVRLVAMSAGNTNRIMAGDLVQLDFTILGGGDTTLRFDPDFTNVAPEEADAVLELENRSLRVSSASMDFGGTLVLSDPSGPAMGNTGAFAYRQSAADDGSGHTTGGACTGEATTALADCNGVTLEMANLILSHFEPTATGDQRVYSFGTGTVRDGNGAPLFKVNNLSVTMDVDYSGGITGSGLAVLDMNDPVTSPLRDELRGNGDQVAFTFHGFNPVVQDAFGVYDFTLTVGPADVPMPTVHFTHTPYRVAEDGGSQTVTVSLGSVPDRVVEVQYTTGDDTALAGSDYSNTHGSLLWRAGDANLDRQLAIPILADNVAEGEETFTISLGMPANAIFDQGFRETVTITEPPPTTTNLSGRVTSSLLGYLAGVQGATITVTDDGGHRYSATTADNTGAWHIDDIPNGTYTVTIAAPGHQTLTLAGRDLAGGELTIDLPATGLAPVDTSANPWDRNGNGVLDLGDVIHWLGELSN